MTEIIEISRDDAMALCIRKEGDLYDRKAANLGGRKTEKIAVALANADGGEFVIGIADDKDEPVPEHRWRGRAVAEDFNHHIQSVFELNPAIDFRHQFLSCSEFPGIVLRIYVQRSPDVCKTSDGTVYQRKGASSLPIRDPARITALSFAKGATSYENALLHELRAEEIVDSAAMRKFFSELAPVQDPLVYCANEALLDRKTFIQTVLVFCSFPTDHNRSFHAGAQLRSPSMTRGRKHLTASISRRTSLLKVHCTSRSTKPLAQSPK
jgi:ATP-dependent DNA helicase RecG